ncbi:MAG: AsmA-like C-terminal domain-containing protein [Desulfuromonadaceae bacterium]|nr:AsmA-like C-terminal domain-containing protein [Desulfuromonadaceae bacterium]
MLRRLAKITGIILIVVTLGSAGAVYLLHHNRNNIVTYVTKQVRAHTNIEIDIADTSIGFRQGITFDMLNIRVHSETEDFTLQAPRLHIRLALLPLLKGEIVCTKAELREPSILWRLSTPNTQVETLTFHDAMQLLSSVKLNQFLSAISMWRHIECDQARIEIHVPHQPTMVFSEANVSLRQIRNQAPLRLDVAALLNINSQAPATPPTHIVLRSTIESTNSASTVTLAEVESHTSLRLDSIHGGVISKYLPSSLATLKVRGDINIEASLDGSFASGLKLAADIRASKAGEGRSALIISYTNDEAVSEIAPGPIGLRATVTYNSDFLSISDLALSCTLFKINGDLSVTPEHNHAKLRCSSAPISLAKLQPWLPESEAKTQKRLFDSKITCIDLRYSGPIAPPTASGVESSRWNIDLPNLIPGPALAQSSQPFNLVLEHRDRKFKIRSSPLKWDTPTFVGSAVLDLQGGWNIERDAYKIEMDLSKISAKVANIPIKNDAEPAHLTVFVQREAHGWSLSDGILRTAEIDASFSGTDLGTLTPSIHLKLLAFDLDSLSRRIRILEKMELGGKVDLDYHIKNTPASNWHGYGDLSLHDCSIAPAHILGRIHHINGVAQLDNLRVFAPELNLKLGEDSPVMRATAYIADLRSPVADIHAFGDGIVANDLIFSSKDALLHNLRGHLKIHATGIDFVSASVDLEQGTHAEVSGILRFATPNLDLDIHAPYADIDEVIALWSSAEDKTEQQNETAPSNGIAPTLPFDETMFIHASVDAGVFSGFGFQQATGKINIQEGQLRIEPLNFRADDGTGSSQILVNTHVGYIKIQGNLNNIDADKVYSQIFKDLGLITGSLTGAFSLHGPIGSQFIPNANGIFKVEIRDGVLRKFKFLSKAFSLLNVAQLFKMRLPDMAVEGMPFSHLSADLSMKNGVLYSDNLLIRSDAMNLALTGNFNLPQMHFDVDMGVNPLGTVDSVFSKIPVAGWILTGDKNALITVEFAIKGPVQDPIVSMNPLSSVSNQVLGILKRTLLLPGTTLTAPGKVILRQKDKEDPVLEEPAQ